MGDQVVDFMQYRCTGGFEIPRDQRHATFLCRVTEALSRCLVESGGVDCDAAEELGDFAAYGERKMSDVFV